MSESLGLSRHDRRDPSVMFFLSHADQQRIGSLTVCLRWLISIYCTYIYILRICIFVICNLYDDSNRFVVPCIDYPWRIRNETRERSASCAVSMR